MEYAISLILCGLLVFVLFSCGPLLRSLITSFRHNYSNIATGPNEDPNWITYRIDQITITNDYINSHMSQLEENTIQTILGLSSNRRGCREILHSADPLVVGFFKCYKPYVGDTVRLYSIATVAHGLTVNDSIVYWHRPGSVVNILDFES